MSFLHGIEVVEIDVGTRPIETPKSSVIGLVGTAPQGPVNVPTLIAGSRKEAVKIFGAPDGESTIPDALDAIFDQIGAAVVVINVLKQKSVNLTDQTFTNKELKLSKAGAIRNSLVVELAGGSETYEYGVDYVVSENTIKLTDNSKITKEKKYDVSYNCPDYEGFKTDGSEDIKGGVNATSGQYEGVQALLAAESTVHVQPRLLIAPGFTGLKDGSDFDAASKDLVSDLITVAERLRAIVIADGPNTTDDDAKSFRKLFDSARLYLVDPYVKVFDAVSQSEVMQPASARVAGIIAKSDHQRGFWYSPSNRPMLGITGTARPIDFVMGDINARANLLNENDVATIIQQDGYRLWGNRSCSSDNKWMFICTRRTADMINDALLRSHLWAVDNNITTSYIENVVRGVNDYLRYLKSLGAIIGGECWADPERNTPDQIQLGRVSFDFDFTPPYPAEKVSFRSQLVNNYLEEVL